MEQFKTLLIAEYNKRKSSYWLPVWIIGGLTVLSILTMIGVWIFENPDIIMYSNDEGPIGIRIGMYGVMFAFSTIFLAFMGLNAQSSLNRERQLGSDLFFRSQPVSFWKVSAAKYIMHVFASALLLLGVGIIYAFVLSIITLINVGGFYFGQALLGTFLGLLNYLKLAMVFGSLCYLFSAIFKNNALLLGAAALGLLEGIFAIIEAIFKFNIHLPDVFVSLGKMVGNMGLDDIDNISFNMIMGNWHIIIGVVFAGLCFVLGSYIYKLRAKDI